MANTPSEYNVAITESTLHYREGLAWHPMQP